MSKATITATCTGCGRLAYGESPGWKCPDCQAESRTVSQWDVEDIEGFLGKVESFGDMMTTAFGPVRAELGVDVEPDINGLAAVPGENGETIPGPQSKAVGLKFFSIMQFLAAERPDDLVDAMRRREMNR
jgi:hypothetical protein